VTSATKSSPAPDGCNWNYQGNGIVDTRHGKIRPFMSHSAQGFTLVEVILALALTATLLGLLSTGVYVVGRDWNSNADRLDRNLDEALSILQIDRALHGAFPHGFIDPETSTRYVYFVGEDDYLSWVSTVSPQRQPGLMAWELFSDDQGVHLSLAPAYSDSPGERLERAEPQLILPGYEAGFSFLYQELDESRQWRDDWLGEEMQSLPLAVHVRFTPLDDQSGTLQELEVVARIASNQHRNLRPSLFQGDLAGGSLFQGNR
jgi:general secretion pathway protein J